MRLEVTGEGLVLKETVRADGREGRPPHGRAVVRSRGGPGGGGDTSPKNRLEWDGHISDVQLKMVVSLMESGNISVEAEASRGNDEITVRYSAESGLFLGTNIVEVPAVFQYLILTLLDPEKASVSLGEATMEMTYGNADSPEERKKNPSRNAVSREREKKAVTRRSVTEADVARALLTNRSWERYASGIQLWKELLPGSGMVGAERSPLLEVVELIYDAASNDLDVLITGASGSGKELIAKAVHYLSRRKDGPFVVVNCGSGADTLFESDFFGHEQGAFTGAARRRRGHFEAAHSGTIFLDEIGEMGPALQAKLLRALEEKKIQRLGGEKAISVDLRVIAATNRDLREAVEKGGFRKDLYYRIKGHVIHMPSLRERVEDMPALIAYFARREEKRLSETLFKSLIWCDWDGSVRELEHFIERSTARRDTTVDVSDIRVREDRRRLDEAFRKYLEAVIEVGLIDERAKVVNELTVILSQMLREAWTCLEEDNEEGRNAAVRSAKIRFREFLLDQGHGEVEKIPAESTCKEMLEACYPKREDVRYIIRHTISTLKDRKRKPPVHLSNRKEGRNRYETLRSFLGISYRWLSSCLGGKKNTG